MRILICNSKTWFSLDEKIQDNHDVKFISTSTELSEDLLAAFDPQLIFFVHWHWIVKDWVYEKYESIVFHTAPLPYGRGGSPIQNLILRGFEEAPVCAIKMTGELDAGPIYTKRNISLRGPLKSIFSEIDDAINQAIIEISETNIKPVEQQGEPVIFKRLGHADNEIPNESSLSEIYDRVRMLDHPDYPDAYIKYGDMVLQFSNADMEGDTLSLSCKISRDPKS